ncbi:hypothetical protein BTR23_13755 [Alkalihalophilus pseudofirmus]|nr:hypothetical protein BTR23_13755 [Alkalihalophilus pseudofirmus]
MLLSKICPDGKDQNVTLVGVGPDINSQFNDVNVSQKTPVIELKSTYGISNLRDIVRTSGNGNVTNNSTEYVLSTANAGDTAILESVEKGRYMPGFAAVGGIAVRLPNNPVGNQIVRWGLFEDTNGYFFGVDGTEGKFIAIRRAETDTIILQDNWNVDPLNGTGPSGLTLNLADGHVFNIVFTWYGYGVIEFRVVMQNQITDAQEVITVHRERIIGQTSTADPNLPIRGEIDNEDTPGEVELFVAGRQYSILGKYGPEFRITSERRTATVETTLFPLISFRRKNEFPPGSNRSNSVTVTLEEIDLLTGSDGFFQIILGGTLTGGTGFINFPTANTTIPNNETGLLVNNSATGISGGQVVYQGVVGGAIGNVRNLATESLRNIQLPGITPITFAVATFSGSTTMTGVFQVREEW